MNTRLQHFLNAENITQAQFADTIGVARASVSHILAGRNKPGFDFIESMAKHYPDINLEWLINGKGKMYKSGDKHIETLSVAPKDDTEITLFETVEKDDPAPKKEKAEQQSRPVSENIREKKAEDNPPVSVISNKQRNISKIVVFYDDNTYQELK